MFDKEIGFHLVDLVFNCTVNPALVAFDLALHATSRLAPGCFEGRTIDLELVFALDINLIVALFFVWIVVWVAGGFAWWLGCISIVFG